MYAELHARSAFSFLEGASTPEDLVETAANLDLPALALADTDNLSGAPRFYMAAKKAGLQAHLGVEVTAAAGDRYTLFAESRTGYQNLCQLITESKLTPRALHLALHDLPPGAEVHATGLEAFAQRVGGLRGSPLSQRQAHGQRLQNSPVPFHAVEMHVDSELVACGQFAIEGPLVGLYDVFTAPNARGRGYARALCRHILQRAHTLGAKHAYLQVDSDNHAARAVYRRLGFTDAYAYHYRALDPSAA